LYEKKTVTGIYKRHAFDKGCVKTFVLILVAISVEKALKKKKVYLGSNRM
jgi:hypothetical protein